jgi:alpha-N-acetylglucosaminidase
MGNIKKWGGILPYGWRTAQANLQKQILERQRLFGMVLIFFLVHYSNLYQTPVLPAFAGHVPDAITRVFPKANITTSAEWAGFAPPYSSKLSQLTT